MVFTQRLTAHAVPANAMDHDAELADWLEDRHRQPPLLLDVRTLKEWNVSHLAGQGVSIRAVPLKRPCRIRPRTLRSLPSVIALPNWQRACGLLVSLEFNVSMVPFSNGQTSIALWFCDGDHVTRVHPYKQFLGRLLSDDVRASL